MWQLIKALYRQNFQYSNCFQVTHDPQRGPLVYMRIYSGSIRPQSTVYNMTRKKTYVIPNIKVSLNAFSLFLSLSLYLPSERITRVLLMLADEQKEMQVMTQGNIAVAVGMKHVSTPLSVNTCMCVVCAQYKQGISWIISLLLICLVNLVMYRWF